MINLRGLLSKHPELIKNKKCFNNALSDMFPNEKHAVRLIVCVYESGIAKRIASLKQINNSTMQMLVNQLYDDYGISKEYATEGIKYWTDCFNIPLLDDYPINNNNQDPIRHSTKTVNTNVSGYASQKMGAMSSSPSKTDCSAEWFIICSINNDTYISKYIGFENKVIIPNNISEKVIVGIGPNAFSSHQNLSSVIMPDTITTISDDAFYACNKLSSIKLSKNLHKIGDRSFQLCKELTHISFGHSVSSIGEQSFSKSGLQSISIPSSVKLMAPRAFFECTDLKEVILSGIIGKYSFYGCSRLERVYINDDVTEIGDCAFLDCNKLLEICIPDSVKRIGDRAFPKPQNNKIILRCNRYSFGWKYGLKNGYLVQEVSSDR